MNLEDNQLGLCDIFPKCQILDPSEYITPAEDKFKTGTNELKLADEVESPVKKRRKCLLPAFSLFDIVFKNLLSPSCKNLGLYGKGLNSV